MFDASDAWKNMENVKDILPYGALMVIYNGKTIRKKRLKDKSKYIRYQQKINYFEGKNRSIVLWVALIELMQAQKFWMYFGPLGPQRLEKWR